MPALYPACGAILARSSNLALWGGTPAGARPEGGPFQRIGTYVHTRKNPLDLHTRPNEISGGGFRFVYYPKTKTKTNNPASTKRNEHETE